MEKITMSNKVRLIIGIVGAVALAVLAAPEVSKLLPMHVSSLLALAIGVALREINAKAPPSEE